MATIILSKMFWMTRTNILLQLILVLGLTRVSDSFCPLACECNEVALSVSCATSELEVLPITLNPGIQRLQLQNNNIRAVDAALGFYAQLQYVDLSNNKLISLPDRGFLQQKKLIELRLSNNKIFKVSNSTFDGLKTVTILSLRKNFIEELHESVFASLTLVEELDLGQNRIKSLDPKAFIKLDHLRVLYLDDNDIQSIPSPALKPLPHLAELNLALNNIKNLPDSSFSSIINLYTLDLHGCSIANISMKAFQGLETLRVLKLSANTLDKVPTLQLQNLERLEELSLGKNYIETIPDRAFQGLRKLRVLDLSESYNLAVVSSLAFQDNSNIGVLSLSGCRKVKIEKGSLLSLNELTTLHLSDLGWTYIDRELVHWQTINLLDLSYNPLVCDCQTGWLREVLARISNTSRAVCDKPEHLAGRDVRNIPPSELRCGGSVSEDQRVIAGVCVFAGTATALLIVVVVHCQKKVCGLSSCDKQGHTSACDKYCPTMDRDSEDSRTESGTDNLYYTDRSMPGLHEKLNELYYPSSTKSTYCEDDYFLSLSKDRKTFKPIRVCEL